MSRDSDPQMFEHLLLEKVGDSNDIMMMSDIIPVDFSKRESERELGDTLQPFVFNMQSHMIESASKHLENIGIDIVQDKNRDLRKIKYKCVKKYFETD